MGGDELANFDFDSIVGACDTVGDWAPNRGVRTHASDEILLIFGYAPRDMTNTPSMCPRPFRYPRVDKPYRMMQTGLGPQYRAGRWGAAGFGQR
jgi:hypothetical protein